MHSIAKQNPVLKNPNPRMYLTKSEWKREGEVLFTLHFECHCVDCTAKYGPEGGRNWWGSMVRGWVDAYNIRKENLQYLQG